MSVKHLGKQIDVHGGGSDLIYPHHENEIAQAECAYGDVPFCGWWMHNGMLELDGMKMSKSLGNLVLTRNLMEVFEPDHLRLYLLSHHLRANANFVDGDMEQLASRYSLLKMAATSEAAGQAVEPGSAVTREFEAAMDTDFDVPTALDRLDTVAQRVTSGVAAEDEAASLRAALATLGFGFAGARGPANGDLSP